MHDLVSLYTLQCQFYQALPPSPVPSTKYENQYAHKTTNEVIERIRVSLQSIADFVTTITFDNEKEFAQHSKLSEALGANIYFARPYHSWERGLNENTNGLVRQYFPKMSSFDSITDDELQAAAWKLNTRPRKCLGYRTPLEVFSEWLMDKGVALRV